MKRKAGRSVAAVSSFTQITAAVRGVAKIHRRASHLWAVHFADAKHGWTVGREGTILHTNNGGEIWREQQSNIEESLLGVYFVNPQTGLGRWNEWINPKHNRWRRELETPEKAELRKTCGGVRISKLQRGLGGRRKTA